MKRDPRIVECVPNVSEGRDRAKIDAIVAAAASAGGVDVRDVDPGADTNRTVITLLGDPAAIQEAAFRLIAKSAELIDMAAHRGAHPRHGATDVCPFVPVAGVTMAECAEWARALGKRVGGELRLPVYLYEQAALRPERRALSFIRQGEYEALPAKLKRPEWRPDFGPVEFNPRFGAVNIGAREFLIAYNLNLNSRDKEHASELAAEIRETGRAVRRGQTDASYGSGAIVKYRPRDGIFPCGDCVGEFPTFAALEEHAARAHAKDLRAELAFFGQDPAALEGKSVMKRGRFAHCRAVGWSIPAYDRAQVSINLTDYHSTNMHHALEECRTLARARGVVVTGSEIVGLVPYAALRESGEYYLAAQGGSRGVPVRDVVETAVQSLGLRDLGKFDKERSILGMPTQDGPLASMRVSELADEVSRATPAPGGGSVAALAGALGAALGAMVANLTHGKRSMAAVHAEAEEAARRCQALKDDLLRAIDADSRAFQEVLAAMRLPRATPEEAARRDAAIQAGYRSAIEVPLATARSALDALRLCRVFVEKGLPSSASDAAVGALMAEASLRGAAYNVRTNLASITDTRFAAEARAECDRLAGEGRRLAAEVESITSRMLG
ncbi:MAG: glutamate formimidoyltransferase [Planctomycetes bacterium]|nr:glutamate formimidoyltransferase [Planctomycetota bacterium]